jgi:hypothetical protein
MKGKMKITRDGGVLAARTSSLLAFLFLALLAPRPNAWTQYPGVPPPALSGSTPGANLRNAAAAVQAQLNALRTATVNWCLRADSGAYNADYFQQDFFNIQSQFQGLRAQFNWLGQLVLQLGRPRADNAVAELDAGLNIIAELLTFLDEQSAAGSLDRVTIARTARVFRDAMREWEREFRKNSSRIGTAW